MGHIPTGYSAKSYNKIRLRPIFSPASVSYFSTETMVQVMQRIDKLIMALRKTFSVNESTLLKQAGEDYMHSYEHTRSGLDATKVPVTGLQGWIYDEEEMQAEEEVEAVPIEFPTLPINKEAERQTVLVLENSQANLNYFEYVLDTLGLKTVLADSGNEVAHFLKDGLTDCILIGISSEMEKMATEFVRGLNKIEGFRNVPKIAVSAQKMNGLRRKLLARGFDDCINGRFKFKKFKKVLHRNLMMHEEPSLDTSQFPNPKA